MNEQQNASNNSIPPVPSSENSGWSWGAFMTDPVFLIGLKKYKYLLWYLVLFIPLAGPFIYIGFKIYLGIKGREISESSTYLQGDERKGFMKGIDHAGKITFFATLVILVLWLIFASVIMGILFSGFSGFFKQRNTIDLKNIPGFQQELNKLPSFPQTQ